MDTLSRHLLVELRGCDPGVLDEFAAIEAVMREAAAAGGAMVVQAVLHQFAPQGVSGVVVLEKSHLRARLGAASAEAMVLERGRPGGRPSMPAARHVASQDDAGAA